MLATFKVIVKHLPLLVRSALDSLLYYLLILVVPTTGFSRCSLYSVLEQLYDLETRTKCSKLIDFHAAKGWLIIKFDCFLASSGTIAPQACLDSCENTVV